MKQTYFVPTAKYKKYLLLDLIDKNKDLTQRELSSLASISLSMVNEYLKEYEERGFIDKDYISKKNVKYSLTDRGIEYMRVQNIGYLSETQKMYNKAKEEITLFLKQIFNKGYKDIILYGAGEVAEIILQTLYGDKTIALNVVSLIDDNKAKQGAKLLNVIINGKDAINKIPHNCIIISSYTNYEAIFDNLLVLNYPHDRIEYFVGNRGNI